MHRPIQSLLAAVIAAGALFAGSLAAAGPAAASTDFAFATGSDPDIAVDGAGTAHVVWLDESQGPLQARTIYCRIPRGARACTNTQVLKTGEGGSSPRVLLRGPQTVIVLLGRYTCGTTDCVLTRESLDNGLSFLAEKIVSEGNVFYADAGGEAVDGPGNSVSFVNGGNPVLDFTNSSLAPLAPPISTPAQLTSFPAVYGPAVGLWGNVPVVVYRDGVTLRWRQYKYGPGFTCLDLNVASCWLTAQEIDTGPFAAPASLAGGPSGLFLYYEQGPAGATQGVVRQFTGSGWGPAIPVTSIGYLRPGDLTQDASGRLHVVWYSNGGADAGLTQWRTSTDGVNWGPTVTINAAPDFLQALHVGAAPDGQGFAVWDSGQPGGSFDYLLAVPLEPFTFPTQPSQPVQPPPPPPIKAPAIGAAHQSAARWRDGNQLAHISRRKKRVPVGTTFSFSLNVQASVAFTFTQRLGGRSVGGKCVAETRKNSRRKSCNRTVTAGTLSFAAHPGSNRVAFQGRVSRSRKLRPGHYKLMITATNSAGPSRPQSLSFTIVS
jgi:hypothetical protein